ncbi:MAG: cytochrome c-type biosis protein CcmE [Solirubrobacteraceae bacterium]|jgi:cytochrome c-type biogenesis protein CcmE|nr:cytochrome c-type biosis protein CcmE [Solirubrobacteraceae bacterium]
MQTLWCADRHLGLRIPVACPAGSSGILKPPMNPARKRRIRLVVAVSAALVLASALIYTSFSASSEAVTPSRLASNAATGRAYQLTGKVVDGSVRDIAGGKTFRVRDRNGTISVPVRYVGAVPDPFRDGREVIVTVRKEGATFVGERDSLVTKCPSKFSDKQQSRPV